MMHVRAHGSKWRMVIWVVVVVVFLLPLIIAGIKVSSSIKLKAFIACILTERRVVCRLVAHVIVAMLVITQVVSRVHLPTIFIVMLHISHQRLRMMIMAWIPWLGIGNVCWRRVDNI